MQLPTPPLPPGFIPPPSGFLEFVMPVRAVRGNCVVGVAPETQQPDSGNTVPASPTPPVAGHVKRRTLSNEPRARVEVRDFHMISTTIHRVGRYQQLTLCAPGAGINNAEGVL